MGDGQRPVVDYWVAKDSGDEGKFRTNVNRNPTVGLTVPNGSCDFGAKEIESCCFSWMAGCFVALLDKLSELW